MKIADQLQPLADLHGDPANVRLHGERNIAAIAASLARFGQQKPIVVQQQGMVVRAGNGTLLAAKNLGWTHIAASIVDMTDTEATAFSIADNRTAELAEWQTEDLLAQLEALGRDDTELLKATGFDQQDLDAMAAELGQDTTNELDDPGPEAPPVIATSRVGDIWVMGDHRLQCGDSTNAADVARLLSGEKPALLSTDPPYCVDYTGAERPQDSGKDWSDQYHEVDIKDLGDFLRATFQAGLPHLQDDAGIYVWHAHLQYPVIDRVFEEFGILRHQPIIWSKASSTFAYSYYRWAHETCLFGWKQGYKPPHYLENGLSTIWDADWEGKARNSTFHPTSKPVRLFEIPMEQHTKPGAVVLEPFCGSGSQLIAAEKLGRRCRAMEISPPFVDGSVLRWEKATGKVATLDGDGRTFAEVAAARGQGPEGP